MPLYVIAGVLISMAVGLLLLGLGRILRSGDEMDSRIEEIAQQIGEGAIADASVSHRQGALSGVDRMLAQRGLAQSIATDLARADLSVTAAEYLAARVGIAILAFLVGYMIDRSLIVGLVAGLGGVLIPPMYVSARQARRLAAFNRQLPDVLERLVGSLRAGYGLSQAVEWVAKQMPDPAGAEFGRVIREMQLGRTLIQSLDSMVRRIDSDDVALIVTAIQIQHEVGGSLADILETVAETIRERVRIQRDIRVLTAQQRFSGYVLIALPIALAIFLYVVNPKYEGELLRPGPTLCIPIGAVLMMIVGYLSMRKIVQIEV